MEKGKAWAYTVHQRRSRERLILEQKQEIKKTKTLVCEPTLDSLEPDMEEYILLRVAKVTHLDLAVSSRLGNATNSSFLCVLFSVEGLMMTLASEWANFSMSALVSLLESGGLSHLAAKGRIYPSGTLWVEENLPWPVFALNKPTNHPL